METVLLPVIIGLITAIVGAVSSANANDTNVELTQDTNRTNQRIQSETNDLQRQLAANSNAWSLQQWLRETNYNTPAEQMERLRSAGANPALAYSHGGLVNEAASSPSVNMANVDAMRNIAPHVDRVVTPDPLTASEIAKNSADAKATFDKNLRESELQPYVIDSITAATDVSKSLADVNRQSIEESMSRIAVNRETASKLSEETYSFVLDNKYKLDTMSIRERMVANQASISDMDVEYFRINAEQSLAQSRALVSKLQAEAKAALAKSNLDETQRSFIQKQLDNYDTTLSNIEAQTKHLNSQSNLNDVEKDIRAKYGADEADQRIRNLRRERITGYFNSFTSGVRDVGVGIGALVRGITQ